MNEFKIKVTDNGEILISIYDIIASLSDEDKQKVVEHFAWQSPLFNEVKEIILNEWAGPNWNDQIHKIRVAFLTGEDADKRVSAVVRQLLAYLKHAQATVDAWESTYWKFYHAWNNFYNQSNWHEERKPFPIEKPAHISLDFPSDTEVKEYIDENTKEEL